MGLSMARRTKRLWTDEEKRSICLQATAADVSVAQVARRYAMNANLIFTWLRDPRFEPGPARQAERDFLPVEIIDHGDEGGHSADDARESDGRIEIDITGGHCLRIVGAYDPEALARLIRGLSG